MVVVGAAAAASAVLTLIASVVQRQVVWPMSVEEKVDRPVPRGAEALWVEIPDGRVEGWYFPALGASPQSPAPAAVFFHGNNDALDHCLEYADTYPQWGYSLLLVDYRGYGRSDGTPSRLGIRGDMITFVDELASRPDVDGDRIVYHGRSIGGAVAADLALHRPPAAMILVSTFTSLEVMFWRYGVPGFIVRDRYRTEDALRGLDLPVLVIHGRRDNIIPVGHGRELGSAGSRTTYIELDANHDLPPDWGEFARLLRTFLDEATA